MLFGNDRIQSIICEKAKEIAAEIKGSIIFGAMVGSISQGVHAVDSDYDTRFLYVRKDFPHNILQPEICQEKDIVTRYYPEEGLFYDKIPLWELSSFLQFIVNPSIDGKFSVGLHHNIAWTFLSPYVWDPFGLSNKLAPFLYQSCNIKFELQYHVSKIEEFFQQGEEILVKNYLYSYIAAASIRYIISENTFAPIHIDSLIGMEQCEDIRQKVRELIMRLRNESSLYVARAQTFSLQGSHYAIRTKHDQLLDRYILDACQEGREMSIRSDGKERERRTKDLVEEMYQIIEHSLSEQIVKGLW